MNNKNVYHFITSKMIEDATDTLLDSEMVEWFDNFIADLARIKVDKCKTDLGKKILIQTFKRINIANKRSSCASWEDVNFIIKWTLEHASHLEVEDTYLIEKETDNCHLAIMQKQDK